MTKKTKIIIAIFVALFSFSALVVLANEAASTIYMPVAYKNYGNVPTATPTPRISITGFHPSSNPQDDYVILKNVTSSQIDLTGWWMKGESESGRYDFPSGFKMNANQTVNVYSGVGTNSTTKLYIGLPYSLWTKSNNCAYLRDSNGYLEDKQCVSQVVPTPTASPTPSVYIAGFNPSSIPENDYVTIANSTTNSFDLTGWWMKAESESGRYDFPPGYILGSGKTVNVVSGIGTDTATNLYIGAPYSLWTSQNNCAYLRYKDGTLLDKECVNP
jgi:hypothetical protein